MLTFFQSLSPTMQAFLATLFTWGVTALGASIVFFFKRVNKTIMDALLGFAAGVMIAASFFSLINPALEMATSLQMKAWLVTSLGFLAGGCLLFLGDKIYDHFDKKRKKQKTKSASMKRCFLLIFSITIHNIPEGLAIGVAFGSLAYDLSGTTLAAALTLALGIGGLSRFRSFFLGQASGIVEPISAVIGALLVLKIQTLLPFLLAFAAGAMIYVVVEELIPESQANQKKDFMAFFTLFGFVLMMILDVALS